MMNLSIEKPTLRLIARPNEANRSGDIFGGWLMSQIDLAGAAVAAQYTKGPVVTVAVKHLHFIKPIFVYDLVSFYTKITNVGRTSITVEIEVYAERNQGTTEEEPVKVSDAILVYVAVSEPGKPRVITK